MKLPPTPWTIQADKHHASVIDAVGQPVIGLTDVELGWTDTSTGPYRDRDSDLSEIQAIVEAVNLVHQIATSKPGFLPYQADAAILLAKARALIP